MTASADVFVRVELSGLGRDATFSSLATDGTAESDALPPLQCRRTTDAQFIAKENAFEKRISEIKPGYRFQ